MWQVEILVSVFFLILESGALIILLYDRKTAWWMAVLTIPTFTLLMTPLEMVISTPQQELSSVFVVTALISWLIYKRKRVMDMLLYSFIFLDAIYMGKVLAQATLLYNVNADFTKISSAEQLIAKCIIGLLAVIITYGIVISFRKLFADLICEKNETVTIWLLFALAFILTDLWSIENMIQGDYSVTGDFIPRIMVLLSIFIFFYIDQQQYLSKLTGHNIDLLLEKHRVYQLCMQMRQGVENGVEKMDCELEETGNSLLDLILYEKEKACSEMGIRIICHGDFAYLDKLEPPEITLIMDSLIEYAIDICQESSVENAAIELSEKAKKSFCIQCKCPCRQMLFKKDKLTEQQQIRRKVIEKTIQKYDGFLKEKRENGTSTITVKIGMEPV